MTIDPVELELRATFYKERLILQDKQQQEVKDLQADQQARLKALKVSQAPAPVAAPAPVPAK